MSILLFPPAWFFDHSGLCQHSENETGNMLVRSFGRDRKLDLRPSGILHNINCNSIAMFWDDLLVSSLRVKRSSWTSGPLKMGLIGCPETLVCNYHSALCKIPGKCRSHLHCNGSLKSCKELRMFSHNQELGLT